MVIVVQRWNEDESGGCGAERGPKGAKYKLLTFREPDARVIVRLVLNITDIQTRSRRSERNWRVEQ